MKFWLDTTSTGQLGFTECTNDDDDDNDCTGGGDFTDPTPFCPARQAEAIHHIRTHVLRQATPLYLQECAPDRWIACNPTGEGHIIVLDTQAKLLLEQFHNARSFEEVLPTFTDVAPEAIERALVLLYQAGLLRCPHLLPVPHESAEDHVLSAWLHIRHSSNYTLSALQNDTPV